MRHPFVKASLLCSPSIDAFPFSLDVSCTLLYVICCLTVYAKEKSNDEKIDMKALSSNECIIMTPIMNWLFEKHNTILLGYFGVQSLISFKARTQFWSTDSFPWTLCRGNFAMSDFCDTHRSIEDCDVKMCHRRNWWSHSSQITNRRSQDRRSRIANCAWSSNHCVLLMRCCDMWCCISAVGDSLIFI